MLTNLRIIMHDGGPTRHRGDELSEKITCWLMVMMAFPILMHIIQGEMVRNNGELIFRVGR